MLTKINNYKVNQRVRRSTLIRNGFREYNNNYVYRKVLYYHDNTKEPYVYLELHIHYWDDRLTMLDTVLCDGGVIYPQFYNLDAHDDLVLEKVIKNYNNTMDTLVENKILKMKHGR